MTQYLTKAFCYYLKFTTYPHQKKGRATSVGTGNKKLAQATLCGIASSNIYMSYSYLVIVHFIKCTILVSPRCVFTLWIIFCKVVI